MLPSVLVLICHSVKPSRDVYLQRLLPSVELRLRKCGTANSDERDHCISDI